MLLWERDSSTIISSSRARMVKLLKCLQNWAGSLIANNGAANPSQDSPIWVNQRMLSAPSWKTYFPVLNLKDGESSSDQPKLDRMDRHYQKGDMGQEIQKLALLTGNAKQFVFPKKS